MKEEYESTIQSLEDEIASLKGNYDKLYEDHLLLKEDYESLQRTWMCFFSLTVATTIYATSPRAIWRPARTVARRCRRSATSRRRR